jgi:hypothetical protein
MHYDCAYQGRSLDLITKVYFGLVGMHFHYDVAYAGRSSGLLAKVHQA